MRACNRQFGRLVAARSRGQRSIGLAAGMVVVASLLLPVVSEADNTKAVVYALSSYNGSTCDNALNNPSNLMYADNMGSNWQDEIDSWNSFATNVLLADSVPGLNSGHQGSELCEWDR